MLRVYCSKDSVCGSKIDIQFSRFMVFLHPCPQLSGAGSSICPCHAQEEFGGTIAYGMFDEFGYKEVPLGLARRLEGVWGKLLGL